MTRYHLVRKMAVLPAVLMLTMVLISASVLEANAVSGEKTFYIPTVLTEKYSDSDGDKATITETRDFTEEGLYVSRSISDEGGLYNRYSVIKRDGKGRQDADQGRGAWRSGGDERHAAQDADFGGRQERALRATSGQAKFAWLAGALR